MPFDEEDPLHFAHGRLAMLLFYSGNAYGPKGMIYGAGINGVNRNLLYPAIRGVAANPVGQARSTLDQTYQNLTAADVDALADTLVESIHFRAPSDKMFSAGIRNGGLKALGKYNNADGVPLAIAYMIDDGRTDAYTAALSTLQRYAGGCTTVTPDPDVIEFCKSLLGGGSATAAQAVLDAIAADPSPAPLTPFKNIQSVTADASSLTLPTNQTVLHASASDLALGNLVYIWRKVHGAGNVTFAPNGTAAAKDCTIVFDNIPGQYLFEVTVSDSRGVTEVYGTVPVTLYNSGGTLPPKDPPTAYPQAVSAAPASVTPITLTGIDPEAYPMIFSITSLPSHGSLSGTAPDVSYVADADYLGPDSFTFQVMDSEGQISTATVSITVSSAGVELYAHESFDYPVGVLTGNNGGQGFSGVWLVPRGANEEGGVWDETTNVTFDGSTLNWDGVLNNGFPTLPATGARYAGATASGTSGQTISRMLASDAGTLAGEDGELWMSVAYHLPNWGNYGAGITIGLGNGYVYDRGKLFGTATTDFTEAVFNAGKITTTSSIDESSLNMLTIAQSRFNNAIDEIRIGNSFASVIGVQGAPADTTPPTLAVADIVDDRGGEPVTQNSPVSYSVTFSEEMDPATVDATDLSNAGSASITIDSVIHPLPGLFVVQVTPVTAGSLQLQVNAGAVLKDSAGNPLETTLAIADDTVITVNPLIVIVPNVAGLPQASAESSLTSAGLMVGAVTTQNSETVTIGNVISQNPGSATSIAEGSGVDLVVSLGPVPDYEAWQTQYPSADLANRAADFDFDGVNNGEERLWGLDPTRASPVTPILEAPGPAGIFRYTRRDPARTGATYTIWTSPNLLPDSWTEDTDASQVPGDPDANHVETVTVTLSSGRLGGERLFIRVRVVE